LKDRQENSENGYGRPIDLPPSVTRGYGFLENFLARQRIREANKMISPSLRSGRILDIGCSEFPYFLLKTEFRERYGLDKIVHPECIARYARENVTLVNYDVESSSVLPFPDEQFAIVTMLAVLEHIEHTRAADLIADIRRILRPGGMFILTTPAAWSDWILSLLALVRLVSPEEIHDHKATYTPTSLRRLLQDAGFATEQVRMGYFECLLNLRATAQKDE
jgi:2-polyprenyl-3-methyl-5-hydroxy-6-metoxy-1,4-benzoquinol methylase